MKISFMTFACPDWDLGQVLDAAGRYGYQGVEFRCDARHTHGVEISATTQQRREIRHRLEDARVEACCLATSLQFASSQALADAPARIELAADIGCPALRVFCGPLPVDRAMEAFMPELAQALRSGAELAAQAQTELWLETHDSVSRAAHAAAAVRLADHPALGINFDNMHPYRMGEALELTLAELTGLIRHTHFHDAMAKPDVVDIRPVGRGELPMDETFAALVRMGYEGYLSGEWFHDMYGHSSDESLANYHRDMSGLIRRHRLAS